MKILTFNILLLTAGAVLASIEAESSESVEESSLFDNRNNGGQNTYFSQHASSHSVINSNGNSVVVSRRFNSKGEEESYISITSPKIRIDGEYFTCTSLTCPADAFKCHVSSEAVADDRSKMKTIAECQDKDGKVLDKKEVIEENPYPKEEPPYSRVADVDRDGSINVQDSNGAQSFTSIRKKLTKEEQEKLDKEIAEHQKRAEEHFKHQMDELQSHLDRVFGPQSGFPFGNAGNPFGPNFPFGSNFPFGFNFPFGSTYGNPFRSSFDDGFGFNNNWPYVSSFGFYPFRSYYPQVTNRYPQYPTNPHHHDDREFIPETFDSNRPSIIQPQRPPTSAPSQDEIETNTEFDVENEIEATTYRGSDNRVMNYNDKYRYAHTN